MRKVLAIVLVLGLFAAPLGANLPKHQNSVQALTSEGNAICTTWSVNKPKGLWVTAAHCVMQTGIVEDTGDAYTVTWPLEIEGKPALVVLISPFGSGWDLALISADVHEPALKLGKYPEVGDEVTVFGLPGGMRGYFPSWVRVSNPFHMWGKDDLSYWKANMIFDGNIWPGHSGSPILDRKGRVISVAQGGFADRFHGLTLGVPWSVLKDFLTDAQEQ